MREDPIMITGVYRSGTTYFSRALDAHPDLDVTYDSVNYFRFIVKKGISPKNYNQIVESIYERLLKRYQILLDRKRIIREIQSFPLITHKEIYSAIMDAFFHYSGKRWGEKVLLEWTNIPTFLSMFSAGKAIHIIRDPRDVLTSYKYMTIEPGNRYFDSVFASMHSLNAALKYMEIMPSDRYYVLIYEDFIKDKEATIKRICDFLGIDYTLSMLDEKKYTDLFGKKFDMKTHTSFPDDTKKMPMGEWKEKLTDFEIDFVEWLLSTQMKASGYELSKKRDANNLRKFFDVILREPLLKERLINYLITGDGVEAYPSDPTDPKNWGDTGIKGQGAAVAYGKKGK